MSDTPWTPGPLVARGNRICANGSLDKVSGPVEAFIGRAGDTEQRDTDGRGWVCGGSPEANARLWAAAPDLFAALDAIIDGRYWSMSDAKFGAAKSALAKARGQS